MFCVWNQCSFLVRDDPQLFSSVLHRFFPRFFFGLVFCGFLLKLWFLFAAWSDCVLQRFVRRFSSYLRKEQVRKSEANLRLAKTHCLVRHKSFWAPGRKTYAATFFCKKDAFLDLNERECIRVRIHMCVACVFCIRQGTLELPVWSCASKFFLFAAGVIVESSPYFLE